MISIYLIIAIICGLLLIIMAAMGGLGDFDAGIDMDMEADVGYGDFGGAGISPLSIPILLCFGALFGCAGVILEELQFDTMLTPVLAIIISLLITGIIFLILIKIFIKSQGTTEVNLSDLVGLVGETTMPTRPGTPGQVMVITEERGRTLVSTVSEIDIPTNTNVKITAVVGTSVRIEKEVK